MLRSRCNVLYDATERRLVYLGVPADEQYWDDHWLSDVSADEVRTPDRFVVATTKKFLPEGGRVLDGGCGLARTVYGLHLSGYKAQGVDYAPNTVATVNRLAPELDVTVGDVRDLRQFEDGCLDGVWSLGVIEHFYDGYRDIVREMHRMLRTGGYAFVTVPSMSPLRRLKAALGLYPRWTGEGIDNFYQFALNLDSVIRTFSEEGMTLVSSRPRGGFKGLKDEVSPLRSALQSIYDNRNRWVRGLRAVADRVLGPATFHTRLLVFRKNP